MKKIAFFYVSIFILLVCSLQTYAHECAHDDIEFEPVKSDILEDLDEVENLDLNAPQTFQPIRIKADFSGKCSSIPSMLSFSFFLVGITNLSAEQREFVSEVLMPNVLKNLREVISIIPEQRKVVLADEYCNDAYIVPSLRRSKIDADLIIFVMAKPEKTNATLASASPCFLHPETGR